ncbi:MAG: hypothetical protein AAGB22_02195 [Bacteroidota bacterium]
MRWKLIVPYLIGLFVFQEVLVRLCFPLPELRNFNRITYQILAAAPNGPGYIRNIHMEWRSTPDTPAVFVHALNTYGYRDRNWTISKSGNKQRILFVGDSFVEGMMAPQEQTIPAGFQAAAGDASSDLDVFNCGMMGIGLNEYIKFLWDAVPIYQPDEVFLVLYSNDIPFQRPYQPPKALEPNFVDPWRPRILHLLDFAKANDPIPFRWGPPAQRFYKPVPDPSNPWTQQAAQYAPHVRPELAEAMKRGDYNFFRANWVLEEEKFLRAGADISGKLQAIRDYLAGHGTQLTVFYIPSRHQVSNHYYAYEREVCLQLCPDRLDLTAEPYQLHRRMLAHDCGQLQIPFHDLTDLVKAEEDRGNHLYWNYDDHMRGKGYMLLGRAIYERWNAARSPS